MPNYSFEFSIETFSEANKTDHWICKNQRRKTQKLQVWAVLHNSSPSINPPCLIKLTRLSSRMMDSDNLVGAFKWIRDEIANYINPGKRPGMADSDTRIKWEYAQEKSKKRSIRIEIFSL